jgi:hypothetical protein
MSFAIGASWTIGKLDSGVAVQHPANAGSRMQDRAATFRSHQHRFNGGLHIVFSMSGFWKRQQKSASIRQRLDELTLWRDELL